MGDGEARKVECSVIAQGIGVTSQSIGIADDGGSCVEYGASGVGVGARESERARAPLREPPGSYADDARDRHVAEAAYAERRDAGSRDGAGIEREEARIREDEDAVGAIGRKGDHARIRVGTADVPQRAV